MTMQDDYTTYQTIPVLHNIKNTSGTIPIKILATNFTVPAKFGKNDLHSSISSTVVQKGEVLLAKKYWSLAKSEK